MTIGGNPYRQGPHFVGLFCCYNCYTLVLDILNVKGLALYFVGVFICQEIYYILLHFTWVLNPLRVFNTPIGGFSLLHQNGARAREGIGQIAKFTNF